MDIYYSPYKLTPLKRANRLSSLDPKHGVYLMGQMGSTRVFADYFPHHPLGDRSVEEFLSTFQTQKDEYDRKVFDLLLKDARYQQQKEASFRNHQLWSGVEPLVAPVVKYKMLHASDVAYLDVLKKGHTLRLDVNGMFNLQNFRDFIASIPVDFVSRIEYVEDPISGKDWSQSPVPTAQDFLESHSADYYIYKPNCEFFPKDRKNVIFSAYLGSDLGVWHTYCEMLRDANLDLCHGIIGHGFYAEERPLFKGSYHDCFYPDLNVVRNIYQELQLRSWKKLCAI
jgi:hypothetical protein